MGNNRIYIKMLISSIFLIVIVFVLLNIFGFKDIVVTITMGISAAYFFISAFLWRLAIVYQDIFFEYDNKYYLKYREKLVLSKNDKHILKHICYTVHDRKKSKSFIEAFKNNNKSNIDNYLLRNNYQIDNKETFYNVILLVSEYLSQKTKIFNCLTLYKQRRTI